MVSTLLVDSATIMLAAEQSSFEIVDSINYGKESAATWPT